MKILVTDDSKTNLSLISYSLKKLGHTTLLAENAQDAIALFRNERPDLIILDVVMSDMDGFECAKEIRQINKDDWIPIIFLSSSVRDEDIAKGINAGGDDYLTKPFSEVTLAAKIKAMQRISDMRQKLYETTLQLQILSTTDSLTHIANRFLFEKTITERIKKSKELSQQFALLFLDLDHFKLINDTLGHQTGDFLIKEMAARIKSTLTENDFIARLGGDEFAIIVDNIKDIYDAGRLAQRVMEVLTQTFELGDNAVSMTTSIGITTYPRGGKTQKSLIQNADIALYHAKQQGRSNYQYFTKELAKKHKKE